MKIRNLLAGAAIAIVTGLIFSPANALVAPPPRGTTF